MIFPAPTKGLIANTNLAKRVPGSAELLDNWFVTATGARPRGGSSRHATIGQFEALTGTVAIDETTMIVGTGTAFETELEAGKTIRIDDEDYVVATIIDDEEITVTEATHDTLSGESADVLVVEDVDAFITYINGNNRSFFACTDLAIYDVTTPNNPAAAEAPIVTGLSSGDWISTQFATSGGVFLIAVNSADDLLRYDGQDWFPVDQQDLNALGYAGGSVIFPVGATITGGTSGATAVVKRVIGDAESGTLWIGDVTSGPFQSAETITGAPSGAAEVNGTITLLAAKITGIDSDELSYVWPYKERIWFVEENSLNAWYLSVSSIAGAATRLPLGGVFQLGGTLLFGASWSLDESAGLAAYNVFVSTEGEVAVYRGSNPGDAADWGLVGVYKIGRPLGKRAWVRAGGDLLIATDVGLISLAQAMKRDLAALAPVALSFAIEDLWNRAVKLRTDEWECRIWPTGQMVMVVPSCSVGQRKEQFVANAVTGAWSVYVDWDVRATIVFRDRFYFGAEGKVVRGESTGADEGSPFLCPMVYRFDDFGQPISPKIAHLARASFTTSHDVNAAVFIAADRNIELPVAPDATQPSVSGDVWGTALWGTALWGTSETPHRYAQERWVDAGAEGYTLAPGIVITSGGAAALDVELSRVDVMYELGELVS